MMNQREAAIGPRTRNGLVWILATSFMIAWIGFATGKIEAKYCFLLVPLTILLGMLIWKLPQLMGDGSSQSVEADLRKGRIKASQTDQPKPLSIAKDDDPKRSA